MYGNTKAHNFNGIFDKKFKVKHKLLNLGDGIEEFSELTSLHGFKYIGENRSVSEKIFWSCVLVCVFILCGFQTLALIKYWMAGKIIMTQENAKLHVWDIPFPAITICSENQLNRSQIDAAQYILKPPDYQDLKDYADMVCFSHYYAQYTDNKISNRALKYAYQNLVVPCNGTIVAYIWINDFVTYACQFFQPVVTETGLCFTHNLIPESQMFRPEYLKVIKSYMLDTYFYEANEQELNWHPALGFRHTEPITPPWRVAGSGVYNSVKMVFNLRPDNFPNFCNVSGHGMSIIIHSPIEFPPHYSSFYLRPSTYNVLIISPEMVTVSDELRGWSPFVRGCYFQDEKYLRFFRVYSLANCELECRANKTRRICGCNAFGHPRLKTTPVCGLAQRMCIMSTGGTGYSIFQNANNSNVALDDYFKKNCHCLPACVDLTYNFEITEMKKNGTHIKNLDTQFAANPKQTTVLEVYFKRDTIDEWHRSPMIRFTELVANVGGIMSLCVGCSIISLFEVIYFIILRRRLTKNKKIHVNSIVPKPAKTNVVSIFVN